MASHFYQEKLFPFFNDLITRSFQRNRARVLQNASGKILEIGFGSGLSLSAYPKTVTEVFGLEPNSGMIARAQKQIAKQQTGPAVQLVQGHSEKIPFPDQTFDGVVSFFTLCSVENLRGTLAELKRVLKSGGSFFLIEHEGASPGTLHRKLQDKMHQPWKTLACGCHCNRDLLATLKEMGFEVIEKKSLGFSGFPNFLSPIWRVWAKDKKTPVCLNY